MTLAQRIAARIATARSDRVNLLVRGNTGVMWQTPVQISREQLQSSAARRLAR